MKINFHKFSIVLLIAATVVNIAVHLSSPAYKYFQDEHKKLQDEYEGFVNQVKTEFVPSIREVCSNMVLTVDRPSTLGFPVPSHDLQVLEVDGLSYVNVRAYGYRSFGCRIRGHDYTIGDTYLGSRIRSITPDSVITDDYILVPRPAEPVKEKSHARSDS